MTNKAPDIGGFFFARRLVITGANGAGKTRLARELARNDKPIIHMDALKLGDGWRPRPPEEVRAALLAATQGEAWVLEGGPSCLIPPVLERADSVLWLRPPHAVRVWRMLRRSARGEARPELPQADTLGLRAMQFAWRSWRKSAWFDRQIAEALADYDPVILRRSPVGRAAESP